MPISDPEGYDLSHFQHVFDDLFAPACRIAGFRPVRADQVRESNFIHLDVLQRLLDSPMVLCDLSSRNPNVLFELGLRQAFDRPVVLVQEIGTPKIFDIAPLRYTEYRRARIYHEVMEDQEKIAGAITATRRAFNQGVGVNSIVRILSLSRPATLPDVQEANRDPALQIIRAELSELRDELRRAVIGKSSGTEQADGARTEDSEKLLLRLKLLRARLSSLSAVPAIPAPTLLQLIQERDSLSSAFAALPTESPYTVEFKENLRRFDREYGELFFRAGKPAG